MVERTRDWWENSLIKNKIFIIIIIGRGEEKERRDKTCAYAEHTVQYRYLWYGSEEQNDLSRVK